MFAVLQAAGPVTPAWAEGGTSGGGGASVVCFDSPELVPQILNARGMISDDFLPHIVSVETYDLAQLKATREPGVVTPEAFPTIPGEGPVAYMERLAQRYDRTVPSIGELIRRASAWVQSATRVSSRNAVVQVHDSAEVMGWDPRYCALTTTIQQAFSAGRLVLTVDQRLLDAEKNSELSQNLLYLHEGLYAIARERGQVTSNNVREFISLIAQVKVPLNVDQLVSRTRALNLMGRWLGDNWNYAYNPLVLSRESNALKDKLKGWEIEFDAAHSGDFKKFAWILVGQRIRLATDILPTGWGDLIAAKVKDHCLNGRGDGGKCLASKIIQKRHPELNAERQEYVKTRLKAAWSKRRAELSSDAALDPRVLTQIDGFVEGLKCRIGLFPVKTGSGNESWTGWCDFLPYGFEEKLPLDTPAVLAGAPGTGDNWPVSTRPQP